MENDKIFYSNSMGLKVTNIDFKLEVKYREDDKIETLCNIIMTPEQAKVTKMMLEQALDKYEEMYRKVEVKENSISKTEGEKTNGGKK